MRCGNSGCTQGCKCWQTPPASKALHIPLSVHWHCNTSHQGQEGCSCQVNSPTERCKKEPGSSKWYQSQADLQAGTHGCRQPRDPAIRVSGRGLMVPWHREHPSIPCHKSQHREMLTDCLENKHNPQISIFQHRISSSTFLCMNTPQKQIHQGWDISDQIPANLKWGLYVPGPNPQEE